MTEIIVKPGFVNLTEGVLVEDLWERPTKPMKPRPIIANERFDKSGFNKKYPLEILLEKIGVKMKPFSDLSESEKDKIGSLIKNVLSKDKITSEEWLKINESNWVFCLVPKDIENCRGYRIENGDFVFTKLVGNRQVNLEENELIWGGAIKPPSNDYSLEQVKASIEIFKIMGSYDSTLVNVQETDRGKEVIKRAKEFILSFNTIFDEVNKLKGIVDRIELKYLESRTLVSSNFSDLTNKIKSLIVLDTSDDPTKNANLLKDILGKMPNGIVVGENEFNNIQILKQEFIVKIREFINNQVSLIANLDNDVNKETLSAELDELKIQIDAFDNNLHSYESNLIAKRLLPESVSMEDTFDNSNIAVLFKLFENKINLDFRASRQFRDLQKMVNKIFAFYENGRTVKFTLIGSLNQFIKNVSEPLLPIVLKQSLLIQPFVNFISRNSYSNDLQTIDEIKLNETQVDKDIIDFYLGYVDISERLELLLTQFLVMENILLHDLAGLKPESYPKPTIQNARGYVPPPVFYEETTLERYVPVRTALKNSFVIIVASVIKSNAFGKIFPKVQTKIVDENKIDLFSKRPTRFFMGVKLKDGEVTAGRGVDIRSVIAATAIILPLLFGIRANSVELIEKGERLFNLANTAGVNTNRGDIGRNLFNEFPSEFQTNSYNESLKKFYNSVFGIDRIINGESIVSKDINIEYIYQIIKLRGLGNVNVNMDLTDTETIMYLYTFPYIDALKSEKLTTRQIDNLANYLFSQRNENNSVLSTYWKILIGNEQNNKKSNDILLQITKEDLQKYLSNALSK